MSSIISPLIACPDIQLRLNEIYPNLNPSEPVPLTAFLASDVNLQGMKMVVKSSSPGKGKARQVDLIYTPRVLESQVSDTLTTDCISDNEPAQTSQEYLIDTDTGAQYSETFNIRDLTLSCQENEDYIASRVAAGLDVVRRQMETNLTSALALQTGLFAVSDDSNYASNTATSNPTVWTSGVSSTRTYKRLQTVYSDGKFNEDALSEIYYSARQAQFNSVPFIFGTKTIEKYFQALKAPADTYWGLNLKEYIKDNYIFMPSYRIADVFNETYSGYGTAERFVALDVNNFFILQYNKFDGMPGLNTLDAQSAGFIQGIIVDPYTGLSFNYKWVYNPCGETASMFISTAYQLQSVPDDMYSNTDRLQGVKGSLVFEIDNYYA